MVKSQIINERDKYSTQLVRVVRLTGLTLPFLIIGYGMLAYLGIIEKSQVFNMPTFIILSIAFVLVGIIEYSIPRRLYEIMVPPFLVIYTLLGAGYIIWISGLDSPITFCWIILLIVCDLYYGRFWFWVSALTLLITSILAYLTLDDAPLSVLVKFVSLAVFTVTVGAVVSALRRIQAIEHTDLQRTKHEQQRQREALLTIINGTNQAIFTVSSQGKVRIYNAAFLSLIDTNRSLSGHSIDNVLPLYGLDGESVSLYKLMKDLSKFERDDLLFRFPDGDEIRLQLSVNRVQSAYSSEGLNEEEGFVCIARDVTKEKSLEEERDEFISVVSHELRTPVAITEGTISNAQFFLEQGADTKKLLPSLKEAHEQIVLLANMINDLGTLSRAERGVGDNTEEINIRELAEELYKKYTASASKKGLTLNLDVSGRLGTINTSRLYLEELLQNLITNAIKYTTEGSVTIQVRREPGGIGFAVKDTGIGISKADLKHIFEKFYRSEDYRTRETSGTGLGLYVVTKLMHKLGTKIEVASRLNHGSTFSFMLHDAPAKKKA